MLLSEAKGLKLVPLIKIVVPPWVEPAGDTNESRLVETSIIVGEPGLTKAESKNWMKSYLKSPGTIKSIKD